MGLGVIGYGVVYHLGYEENEKNSSKLGEINMINQNRWEKLTMAADSGAVDHVCSKKELGFLPIEPTAVSKAGMCYRGASGDKIDSFGMRSINGVTSTGTRAKIEIQVADIRRGLASIPRMVDEDNDVAFSKRGSYIKNIPTGAATPMRRANGVMEFDLLVERPEVRCQFGMFAEVDEDILPTSGDDGESDSAFGRLVTRI